MKRLVLALALAATTLTAPASAQYYGGYGGYGDRPDYAGPRSYRRYDDEEQRRYERRREREIDRDERRRDQGRFDDRRGPPPARRFDPGGAGACLTVQGVCPGRGGPRGAPCSCNGLGGVTQ